MTPSRKRSKARQLVEWVAERLKLAFPDYEDQITVPKTSDPGEDLIIGSDLRKLLPHSFEMKNQKGYAHVYNDMDQTIRNAKEYMPVLIVKSPYKEPLVIIRFSDYEKGLG